MIYLAVPYSHKNKNVRELRFEIANMVTAILIRSGAIVYSPISHTHPVDKYMKGDFGWVEFDFNFLKHCKKLVILRLPGWKESEGIKREMEYANNNNIKIQR